jgi:hypothetical protein
MKIFSCGVLIGSLTIICFSCGQSSKTDQPVQSKAFAVARDNFFQSLKKPDTVSAIIASSATAFDSTIVHHPEAFVKYTSNDIKAAGNLGIYLSDLNYCILLKQGPKARKFFEASYELSKAMGAEKKTLEFLMQRYASTLAQNDSLSKAFGDLFRNSTLDLKDTDRERLAGVVIAGYQIENLHLVLSVLASLPSEPNEDQIRLKNHLLDYILAQQGRWEMVFNFLQANSDPMDPDRNPNYPFFNNALRELIMVYRSISPNDYRTDELKEKVTAIRSKLISA